MRTDTERLKINKRDTQKDGIEYPKSVERVMMTSAGRPRLHPEIRPRMIPSHMVAAVATPTRISVVERRGGVMGRKRSPGWCVIGDPKIPEKKFPGDVGKRMMQGRAIGHYVITYPRRGETP